MPSETLSALVQCPWLIACLFSMHGTGLRYRTASNTDGWKEKFATARAGRVDFKGRGKFDVSRLKVTIRIRKPQFIGVSFSSQESRHSFIYPQDECWTWFFIAVYMRYRRTASGTRMSQMEYIGLQPLADDNHGWWDADFLVHCLTYYLFGVVLRKISYI